MGAEVLPLFDPENYKRVVLRIKNLWNDGNYVIVYHARQREKKWQFDDFDVRNILLFGRIIEHSKPENLWRYTVEGKTIDGVRAACVVELDENRLIVVTVVDKSGRL